MTKIEEFKKLEQFEQFDELYKLSGIVVGLYRHPLGGGKVQGVEFKTRELLMKEVQRLYAEKLKSINEAYKTMAKEIE